VERLENDPKDIQVLIPGAVNAPLDGKRASKRWGDNPGFPRRVLIRGRQRETCHKKRQQ
jgi:hypothetical protein